MGPCYLPRHAGAVSSAVELLVYTEPVGSSILSLPTMFRLVARPHLYPLHMPVFRLVHFANGNDVATVIVDGKILMEDRTVTSVNETKVLEEAQKEAELMLDRGKFRPLLKALPSFWGHTRQ